MVTIYVSPDGDDAAGGRTPETPLATLDAARDAVREETADGMDGDATVALRGGTYHREEPLVLGPRDSGRDGHRVVYTNYADEEPVVLGGTPVTDWEHHEGDVYRADVAPRPAGRSRRRVELVLGRARRGVGRSRLGHRGTRRRDALRTRRRQPLRRPERPRVPLPAGGVLPRRPSGSTTSGSRG
jgi:hypothetical protein